MNEKGIWKGVAWCYLRLGGGEVSFQRVRETLLSLARLLGEERLAIPLGCSALG
jgi:hypothetical protein